MAFFAGKPHEFYEKIHAEAARRICESYGITEEELKEDTIEILTDDHIDGPWLITFLVRRRGTMYYQVSIDPDEINGEKET